MRMQSAQMKGRMCPAAERRSLDEMIDVGIGPLRLAPPEVEEDRESCAPDDRENLHERGSREIRVDRALKRVRYLDASHDLDDDRIDAPEVFDLVDDQSLAHETI